MKIKGQPTRTIRPAADGLAVEIIDQTLLPHSLTWVRLETLEHTVVAIKDMKVRGAPLIGATAAYGVALALATDTSDDRIEVTCKALLATRPTAVNLRWAIEEMRRLLLPLPVDERRSAAWKRAVEICDEDVALNSAIGDHAFVIIKALWEKQLAAGAQRLNILTHCNAGWLATVDWGTATAGIYKAHDGGVPLHVWVDETRPRNQGASLTARELNWHGVPHTVVADNAGGHLMQHGLVDMCIVGTDRTTAAGDVANKIGTYLKALAARDNGVPFYVALPGPTIDWTIADGLRQIPIEERSAKEVTFISGRLTDGCIASVQLTPDGSPAANPGFDVTPARLITRLITERGVCPASREGLLSLYPERRALTTDRDAAGVT
jgi:methylthioribose-1-phosphate isomerase